MTQTEMNIKDLTAFVTDLYYVKRDYENLSFFLSDDISWIGTGKNEICLNQEEAFRFFEKEMEVFDGNFEVNEQWFECKQVTEDVCVVLAVIKIKLNTENALLPYEALRFSIVWKKNEDDDGWKISHIHNSLPDKSIGDETYFNLDIAESHYHYINDSIRKAAHTDTLTQINNAMGFENDIDLLLKKYPNKQYAVIKFGIRNFRFINRRHSFAVGDEVLKNIAKNLLKTIHEDETCARMEKDDFAIMYQVNDKQSVEKKLRSIKEKLIDKRLKNKLKVDIQLKAGIYMIQDNRESAKDILDKALMALQSLKNEDRDHDLAYYHDEMLERQFFSSKVIEDAPKAMMNDEFRLYIQPQFDIETKEIIAGEALTRWKLPSEIRMPNDFIPLFEERGMILTFDFYMLDKLCKQMREWLDCGLMISPVSINQSRLHIQEDNYLEKFCQIVDKYDIQHSYIAFELTESAFIEDSDRMMQLANNLHEKGFQLAIDDFGTGYASLNLLTEISADVLKIDKA
ncbi:MAG: EAL domain-containing protein, partial [Longicatena sp.]